jgi:hypothetical protein
MGPNKGRKLFRLGVPLIILINSICLKIEPHYHFIRRYETICFKTREFKGGSSILRDDFLGCWKTLWVLVSNARIFLCNQQAKLEWDSKNKWIWSEQDFWRCGWYVTASNQRIFYNQYNLHLEFSGISFYYSVNSRTFSRLHGLYGVLTTMSLILLPVYLPQQAFGILLLHSVNLILSEQSENFSGRIWHQ